MHTQGTHTHKFQKCHVQIWWHASREIFLMQEMRWKMWMRRWDYQHWLGGMCFFFNVIFMQWLIWGAAEAIGQPSSSETCGQKGSIKPGMLRRMNLHWKWEKSRVPATSQKQIISGQWFCVFFWCWFQRFSGAMFTVSQPRFHPNPRRKPFLRCRVVIGWPSSGVWRFFWDNRSPNCEGSELPSYWPVC